MKDCELFYLPTEISSGVFFSDDSFKIRTTPERSVKMFEIEFFTSNSGITILNGKEYQIKEGSMLIAKPGQIRNSILPFSALYIKFCVEGKLQNILNRIPDFLIPLHSEEISDLFKNIILLNENIDECTLEIYSKLLYLINLIELDKNLTNNFENTNRIITKKARNYIDNNYSKKISLADISSYCNLSPTYFHSVFSATEGLTPHDYIINKRINKSKEMLWDNSISIAFIAESCGFFSQSYFNYFFKRQTGLTPLNYRKEIISKYYNSL